MPDFELLTLRAAAGASATLYRYGAHLVSWYAAGRERLFTSSSTALRNGVAIRGGVPIIFPQFAGFGPLPKHGFARTASWQVMQQRDDSVQLQLTDSAASRRLWPTQFVADYQVQLTADALQMTLSIRNTDPGIMTFTAALHSYLRVAHLAEVAVAGLQGLTYSNSAAGGIQAVETAPELRITGEVDRIYFSAAQPLTVREPGQRSIVCSAAGFADAVIWNPGAEKAAGLPDLEADGYRQLLCVEAAVVNQPVSLVPGATWSGAQQLTLGH
jgi:glucose-6-phosphate 1-epimerase